MGLPDFPQDRESRADRVVRDVDSNLAKTIIEEDAPSLPLGVCPVT